MRRCVLGAVAVSILVLCSLLSPILVPVSKAPVPTRAVASQLVIESILFPDRINTSLNVTEYPLVSRALMLGGGSSDVEVADLNDDGLLDLMVAVYALRTISIFYRDSDGRLPTYPSFNITTEDSPVSIAFMDVFGSGGNQIAVLERDPIFSTTSLAVYNLTSETSYDVMPSHTTFSNARSFVVGNFSGDRYPDVAVACAGSNPASNPGILQIFFGPDFDTFTASNGGLGTEAIAAGDLNSDGLEEIAIANYYSSNIMVFSQPFTLGKPPTQIMSVAGSPIGLASGKLDGDTLDDLAVITQSPSAVRFFFQSIDTLPVSENYNRSIDVQPSFILAANMSGTSGDDLLILSRSGNLSMGFFQRSSAPIWPLVPDFKFPAGATPAAASVGELDGDSLQDIVVASARSDWSGSSVALYPNRRPVYSNSNSTAWTNRSTAPFTLGAGDIDGDDIQDLVILNVASASLELYFSFAGDPEPVPLGFIPGDVVVADFNLDGFSDVLLAMQNGPTLGMVYGAASLPLPYAELSCGGSITSIATGDFNHDDLLDVLVATEDGHLDIFFNNGQASAFDTSYDIALTPGAGIWSVTVNDFNSDGMDDIAYTRSIRKIIVLLQQETGPFSPSSPSYTLSHSVGSDFTSLWSGDVTGDSKADIVAMRPYYASLYLFDQRDFETAPHPYRTLDLPEIPKFVSVMDATDDGHADVLAIFHFAELVFLYRQSGSGLPRTPSMAFVTGASPVYATIGDGTRDNRGDLLVLESGSHSVSAWEQLNFPPVAHAGGPYFTRQGDALQLNSSVKTGTSELPYMEYKWDFGDGNQTGWIRQYKLTHVYFDVGNYSVRLDVRDPVGLSSTDSSYVIVEDSYPHVSFDWAPSVVEEGRSVTFTDRTYSFDPVVLRSWYVDGSYEGASPNLTMDLQDGPHVVMLEVTDSDGTTANITHVIDVASTAPTLRLVALVDAIEGTLVEFRVLVDEWRPSPVDPITLFEWDFSYVTDNFIADPNAPNGDTASHVFSTTSWWKIYRVAVRATDSDGVVNMTTRDIRIFDSAPVSDIGLNTSTPMEGVPFSFISNPYSYDGIVNWTWRLVYPNGSSEYFYLDNREMAGLEFDYLDDGSCTMYLTVSEEDGNTSTASIAFQVAEIAPFVELSSEPVIGWDGYYEEFSQVNFSAIVSGHDVAALFEWDFVAPGAEFIPDFVSSGSSTANHVYDQIGNYTCKVRVTDSDGSVAIHGVYVEIRQKPLGGGFYYYGVFVQRSAPDTSIITYDVTPLLAEFPDLEEMLWDFGDGTTLRVVSSLGAPVTHAYTVGRDYDVNLTIWDDDGFSYVLRGRVYVIPPTIDLLEPNSGSVVRSGTPILFLITPGSTQVEHVLYDVNGGGYRYFTKLYTIDTTGWPDGTYVFSVIVWDGGGNLAIKSNLTIVVDDAAPLAFLSSAKSRAFGGDKLNVTIRVDDRNVVSTGIILYVRFQGETAFSAFGVSQARNGVFYRVLNLPLEEGLIEMYATVTDLAGNSVETQLYSLEVELHLIDRYWPLMLVSSLLAVVGLAGYFMREARIAVDEAFVIYNDGRLISHNTRRLKPGMDDQVLGGMFVAIQDFVRDSFKDITSFTLRKLEFGEKQILIEKGEHLFLAVILHGHASRKVALKMRKAVDEIEAKFSDHLKEWDGDLDKVRGVSDIVGKLYSRAPVFPGSMRKT